MERYPEKDSEKENDGILYRTAKDEGHLGMFKMQKQPEETHKSLTL